MVVTCNPNADLNYSPKRLDGVCVAKEGLAVACVGEGLLKYLVLMIGVGFAIEQQLRALAMPLTACPHKRHPTVLDARGLLRP